MNAEQRPALEAMVFENARGRDFLEIAELDRRAWLDNRNPEFIPDGEHVWRIWVDGAWVHVARDGTQIPGVILAFPTRGGALCVHKVMVDKSWRGLGIGTRLFESLLAEVDRSLGAACYLTVDPANAAALPDFDTSEAHFSPTPCNGAGFRGASRQNPRYMDC